MSQVLSAIQYICFQKTSGSTNGDAKLTSCRGAPSNLVTPLLTYKYCYSFIHAAIWFSQGHWFRHETHPLTLVLQN